MLAWRDAAYELLALSVWQFSCTVEPLTLRWKYLDETNDKVSISPSDPYHCSIAGVST